MAIYSVGRRRIVIVLLLTSVLLLTLDLRGSAVLDRVRDVAAVSMTPVETAVDVVTSPVERAWESYTNYDELERENEALRERLARIEGSQAAAEAAIIDATLVEAAGGTVVVVDGEAANLKVTRPVDLALAAAALDAGDNAAAGGGAGG